jgi:hypothetical protein
MSHHEKSQEQLEREADEGRRSQERNTAIAIALLAGLVAAVLILVASGSTGMFHP